MADSVGYNHDEISDKISYGKILQSPMSVKLGVKMFQLLLNLAGGLAAVLLSNLPF